MRFSYQTPLSWYQPWYQAWQSFGERVQYMGTCHEIDLASALNRVAQEQHQTTQFITQINASTSTSTLTSSSTLLSHSVTQWVDYEHFIHQNQCIPTRHHWHDFWNGLVWLRFPKTKHQLNQAHQPYLEGDRQQGRRHAVRDALTLFDENAALLAAPPDVWQALIQRDWQQAFRVHHKQWEHCKIILFGHALLEKLMNPFKAITAHLYIIPIPNAAEASDEALDDWLHRAIQHQIWQPKPFTPLPIMGIPTWMPQQDAAFYEDTQVFRCGFKR